VKEADKISRQHVLVLPAAISSLRFANASSALRVNRAQLDPLSLRAHNAHVVRISNRKVQGQRAWMKQVQGPKINRAPRQIGAARSMRNNRGLKQRCGLSRHAKFVSCLAGFKSLAPVAIRIKGMPLRRCVLSAHA